MDFKEATELLGRVVTQEEIAEAASVSHAAVRQARLDPTSASYRRPPEGWEKAIAKLAEARATELTKLAAELREAGE
jgi:hypothetical protein